MKRLILFIACLVLWSSVSQASLEDDGVWAGGTWAATVWADGVWREGAPATNGNDARHGLGFGIGVSL